MHGREGMAPRWSALWFRVSNGYQCIVGLRDERPQVYVRSSKGGKYNGFLWSYRIFRGFVRECLVFVSAE